MGLFRTAARASVATRVVGSTRRRQEKRWAAEDAATVAAAGQVPAAAPVPAPAGNMPSVIEQLTQLGELHKAGVLTDAEFEAQKQKVLNG